MLLDIKQFPYKRIRFAYKGVHEWEFRYLIIKSLG